MLMQLSGLLINRLAMALCCVNRVVSMFLSMSSPGEIAAKVVGTNPNKDV